MPIGIEPCLFFDGRSEEALAPCERAPGAMVEAKMRCADSPEPVPAGHMPPGGPQKILHASFRVGDACVMIADGAPIGGSGSCGFSLSLDCPTKAEARRIVDALAEGGRIDMPMGRTFLSPCFGVVTDPFGVQSMVMAATEAPR